MAAVIGVAWVLTFDNECLASLKVGNQFEGELPIVTLSAPEGMALNRIPVEGKVTLLDLWATWCENFDKALPELSELSDTYGNRGLAVVAVSIDLPSAANAVRELVAGYPPNIVYGHDTTRTAMRRFGGIGVPLSLLVMPDGRIVKRVHGIHSSYYETTTFWATAEGRRLIEESLLTLDNQGWHGAAQGDSSYRYPHRQLRS